MTVHKHTFGGSDVAVVTVAPADSPPVRCRGRIWTRVGPRRAIASAQDERILGEKSALHRADQGGLAWVSPSGRVASRVSRIDGHGSYRLVSIWSELRNALEEFACLKSVHSKPKRICRGF